MFRMGDRVYPAEETIEQLTNGKYKMVGMPWFQEKRPVTTKGYNYLSIGTTSTYTGVTSQRYC